MSHAEGGFLLRLSRDIGLNESFQPPGFYGSPCGWAVPPLQQLRPRQFSRGCSLASTNLWHLSRALLYLLSNKHRHKDSKNAGLLSCYLYQRLIDGLKGPRDVYNATTFPYEFDVELNSQL